MKISTLLIEAEVGGDDAVVANLKNLGFDVQPNEAGGKVYTVSKDGQSALLDLTTFEDMHDSLRTIEAAFDLGMDVEEPEFPIMNQKSSDHKLAQRVAAIGESEKTKIPVTASSSHRGKTHHHDVFLVQPDVATVKMQQMVGKKAQPIVQIAGTPGNWFLENFMQGSGPLAIDFGSNWILVNADEIRDYLAGQQSFAESKKKGLWYNIQQKRKRMGKNYRPAQPGEKGRPDPDAWENAQK